MFVCICVCLGLCFKARLILAAKIHLEFEFLAAHQREPATVLNVALSFRTENMYVYKEGISQTPGGTVTLLVSEGGWMVDLSDRCRDFVNVEMNHSSVEEGVSGAQGHLCRS